MRSILRHLSRVYLAAHLLAWLPAGASGSVLCVEPGGHVRIEAAPACCADAPTAVTEGGRADAIATADACGPCLDVKLGGPHARLAQASGAVQAPLVAILPAHAEPLASPRDAAGAIPAAAPRAGSSSRHLGTTILRN